MARKGLYHNINNRKKSGTSRSKSNSTISDKAYANMKAGFKDGGVRRKYAVGGLTPSASMYGNNTIPYTASAVYKESNPEYQAQLADELQSVQTDTSYQEDAYAEINRQNQVEGRVKQVGSMGLNKLADMAPDDFVGPDMGQKPKELLRSGAEAFKTQRNLNRIYKGTATAKQVGKASADTTQLLSNLGNYGNTAMKTTSAASAGVDAIKSGAGVGTVGALMAYGGDKLYDKVDDNDATTLTTKEAGASALRGAGAGIGAVSTASAIGATVLPAMFGVGAANAWNPIGWATLAAAGIGAGITAINRKRKANNAGDAMDAADAKQTADVANINRMQRLDALKDKEYSGFDYGGDSKGPGFYGKTGGIRQYQDAGLFGYDDAPAEEVQYDRFGSPIGQNLYGGYETATDSALPAGFTPPVIDGLTNDTIPITKIDEADSNVTPYMSSEDILAQHQRSKESGEAGVANIEAAEEAERLKINKERGYSIQTARDGSTFRVPVQRDHPTEEQMNLTAAQNKGVNPNAAWMYGTTGIAGDARAIGKYTYENPNTNPEAINMFGTVAALPGVVGSAYTAAPLTASIPGMLTSGAVNQALQPLRHYGGNTVSSFNALRQGGSAMNMLSNSAKLGYNALTTKSVLKGYNSGASQIGTEMSGEGNSNNRWNTASDVMSLFGGAKSRFAQGLTGNLVGNISPKTVIKGYQDYQDEDYLSLVGRGVNSFLPKGPLRNVGQFINKLTPNVDADDTIPESIANVSSEIPNVLANINPRMIKPIGYKSGGVKNLPGGQAIDIGNGATKYVGQTHEEGGIMADPESEIENDEIEKDVTLADGTKNPYIYSEYLNMDGSKGYKTGGISIADKAEELALTGAPQSEFDALATMQEKAAGRTGNKIMNTTMAKYGGLTYRDGGVKKYQETGVKPTLAGLQSRTNSNVTSMLQIPSTTSSIIPARNTGLNRNELNLSGNSGSKNYGVDYMRTLSGGGKFGGNVNYTPDNISAGLKGSFGNNNNNTWFAGANKSLVDPTSTVPASNTGMNFNVGAKFKWQDGGVRSYQTGGVTQYQTRGLVMSQERQEQYENLIEFVPGIGYIGPDGTNYGFNEADVVDFVNRGGLDSYNPNQGDNYMPSDEAMDQYGLENRQQILKDSLRNNGYQSPSYNEAVADSDLAERYATGRQGDLVVPANTTPTSIDPANQDLDAINAFVEEQRQREIADRAAAEAEIDRVQAESAAREDAEQETQSPRRSTITSPFDTIAEERAFQDWANEAGYDTKGYGWGSASQNIFDEYGQDFFVARANAGGDPLRVSTSSVMNNSASGKENPLLTNRGLRAALGQGLGSSSTVSSDGDSDGGGGDDGDDGNSGGGSGGGNSNYTDSEGSAKKGRLLKAAQFIPAALAYMDKPDYMKQPNRVGGVPRVNLENVSLDDRQATINSDSAAMQRMISNSGMGTAGFAARMAAWNKKEGLSAAVTAEEQRLNNQINNSEAQMNAEVEARNRMIQSQNRDASMKVDQFNTESRAATKAQRVSAVANATAGLLTQFMDQKRMDTQERIGANISGETGVLQRENFNLLTQLNNLTPGTDEYNEFEDAYYADKKKKKFGGMKQIPRYGYSTK